MRYKRMDLKEFVKQLAQIEHRQARIHHICPTRSANPHSDEECPAEPKDHHAIGKTENFPEHLGLFIQRHSGDPAVEVCVGIPPLRHL